MKFPKFNIDIQKANVGRKDRIVRVAVAALLLLGFYNGGFHNWFLALIAVGLLASAYFRFCPAYVVAGIDTTKDDTPAGQ